MSTPPQPEDSPLNTSGQQSADGPRDDDDVDEEILDRPERNADDRQDLLGLEIDVREDPFSIVDLVRKIDTKRLILAPDFQRNEVWDLTKRSRFIESVLLNYPLPPLYLNQQKDGVYLVVDGLQRTSSIYRFIKNEYELQGLDRLRSLNGKKFNTLEPFIQARIEDRKLNCYLLKPSVPFEVVYDIFGRINTGGMALNKQELRHAFYQGPAIVLLKRLAAQPQFSNWLGVRLNTKRMIDQEAVLRCIAFARVDPSIAYRGNLDKFLNEALKQLNSKSSEAQAERDTIEEQFPRTMQLAHDLLGEDAFRLPALQRRGRLNIPVMESIYRALLLRPRSFWQEQPQLSERYRSLLVYDKYREAVRIGTNNTVHIRFPMAQEFLEGTNV
jgi:hypothetical protein